LNRIHFRACTAFLHYKMNILLSVAIEDKQRRNENQFSKCDYGSALGREPRGPSLTSGTSPIVRRPGAIQKAARRGEIASRLTRDGHRITRERSQTASDAT